MFPGKKLRKVRCLLALTILILVSSAVFGVFLGQKLANKPYTIVGDGEQTRDFIYAGDVAAGKAKYATCAACHGMNAEGQGIFPKLVGQSAADLSSKLKKYRAGEQVGPMTAMMTPNASGLSDGDIDDLSAYIASL